jgi:hypothetical protein
MFLFTITSRSGKTKTARGPNFLHLMAGLTVHGAIPSYPIIPCHDVAFNSHGQILTYFLTSHNALIPYCI